MKKLLATDLDGTLLYPKRRFTLVYSKNLEFIRNYSKNGGKVVLITGRSTEFCAKIAKKLDINCDFISYVGTCIIRENKIFSEYFIPADIGIEIDAMLTKSKLTIGRLYSLKGHPIMSNGWEYSVMSQFLLFLFNLGNVRYYDRIVYSKRYFYKNLNKDAQICKINLVFWNHDTDKVLPVIKEMRDKFGDCLEFIIGRRSCEITPKNIDKGKRLKELTDSYGIDPKDVIVVGDDGNDIAMFNLFPNSFAMSTGTFEAKAAAKYIIKNIAELDQYLK